jgi:hypothetical protein
VLLGLGFGLRLYFIVISGYEPLRLLQLINWSERTFRLCGKESLSVKLLMAKYMVVPVNALTQILI